MQKKSIFFPAASVTSCLRLSNINMLFIPLDVSGTKRCFQCCDTENGFVSAKVITRHSSAEGERREKHAAT